MPRPSKTKEWPNNNKIAIYLKERDTIELFETDEKGIVWTKKRSWAIEALEKEIFKASKS